MFSLPQTWLRIIILPKFFTFLTTKKLSILLFSAWNNESPARRTQPLVKSGMRKTSFCHRQSRTDPQEALKRVGFSKLKCQTSPDWVLSLAPGLFPCSHRWTGSSEVSFVWTASASEQWPGGACRAGNTDQPGKFMAKTMVMVKTATLPCECCWWGCLWRSPRVPQQLQELPLELRPAGNTSVTSKNTQRANAVLSSCLLVRAPAISTSPVPTRLLLTPIFDY